MVFQEKVLIKKWSNLRQKIQIKSLFSLIVRKINFEGSLTNNKQGDIK